MAKVKQPKARFSNPDMKHLGEEPLFDASQGSEWDGRSAETMKALNWYNYFTSKKDLIPDMYEYARTVLKLKKSDLFSFKSGAAAWAHSTIGALIRMEQRGYVLDEQQKQQIKESILKVVEQGRSSANNTKEPEKKKSAVTLTIQDRLRLKVSATILEDIRVLEDDLAAGKEIKDFDAYKLMQAHQLPAMACSYALPWITNLRDQYDDALTKSCDQAVESYRHVTKKELKERVKILNKILDDVKRYQANSKTVRKTRAKKPVLATKQVSKLKYLKDSPEFKLVSINPASIVGSARLFVFNVKTRVLAEYVSAGSEGLSVKGTTIQGWDDKNSISKKLRKPEEMLPVVLSKTARQIDNGMKKLTTKDSVPNGRINTDTILLRVLNA